MRLMKESKGAKILINISLEENNLKHLLGFRKKFKRLLMSKTPAHKKLNKTVWNCTQKFVNLHCLKSFKEPSRARPAM